MLANCQETYADAILYTCQQSLLGAEYVFLSGDAAHTGLLLVNNLAEPGTHNRAVPGLGGLVKSVCDQSGLFESVSDVVSYLRLHFVT